MPETQGSLSLSQAVCRSRGYAAVAGHDASYGVLGAGRTLARRGGGANVNQR